MVFSCLLQLLSPCFAQHTISPGQSLTGNQNLTSIGDNFVLGFFTPGNSHNWYIGIWYSKVSVQTVVWVANRDKPLADNKSELKISEDGNLVLLNKTQHLIWSTNLSLSSTSANATVAEILDTGNLVLRAVNSSEFLWQSLDNPTDTWLTGGKLGLNKKTNKTQLLTAWRNSEDPSPGPFSLELDPNGTRQYFLIGNGTNQYWTSGVWNNHIFSRVPEMRSNYIYDFSFIDNENESYFNYTVKDNSTISRFVMHVAGLVRQYTWIESTKTWNLFWSQPRDPCEVHALCGAYGTCKQNLPFCTCLQGFNRLSQKDWDLDSAVSGCVRKTQLQCQNNSLTNGQQDGFLELTGISLADKDSHPVSVGSAEECRSACLRNCSCTAYKYGSSCSIWFNDLFNAKQDSSDNLPVVCLKLAAAELANINKPGKKNRVTGVVAGSVAAFVVVSVVVLGLICRCHMHESRRKLKVQQGSLIPFSYRDLQNATKNFSEKLGGGGFGSVFKGTLPDKTVVAVKKLEGLRQGEKQFRMEVSTIGTIQHVNLVRLRGFCSEGTKRLLVYDYMPNGSLDKLLFQEGSTIINWKARYEIALGTARGIAYLHEKCRDCIIHCDIKPENILLDGGFCPKVADFGLAKLLGREFSRVLTTMRGTRGYLAPEWISGLAITPKADVYSYGMTLLELISGRRNSDHSENAKFGFFPTWAAKMIVEDKVLSLLDSKLEGNADVGELNRACRVACWCIQDDENARPSMGQVVQILEGVAEVTTPPIPRSLELLAYNPENIVFFLESSGSTQPRSKALSSTSSANSQ
ncbi:hypothetical protein AMTR_s00072p00045010 [Amborella trichopoda]|uniref:Receptor-like serine/threonine-protein kinase n=2 Tax=Amborella trichopoda TaxID=13333 RepID=W1NS07_AMBTC|nr:hypothetical protein AMTR_s00072p00045010 [Amborella trichopoda]